MNTSSMPPTWVATNERESYARALATSNPQLSAHVTIVEANTSSILDSIREDDANNKNPTLDLAQRWYYNPGDDFTIFHPLNIANAWLLTWINQVEWDVELISWWYRLSRTFHDRLMKVVSDDVSRLYIS